MSEVLKPKPNRRVLIVEDSSSWLSLLPELYDNEGIQAVAALEAGGFTEVLTDSLEGDWGLVLLRVQMAYRLDY